MEEYRFGGSKGSGAKSSKSFRLEVEAPTTTTTTTTTTSVTEEMHYHPDYLDYSEIETTEENKDSEESLEYHDYYGHNEEHHDEDYPETQDDEHHHHSEEQLLQDGEDDELEDQEHEIREHSEAMTEHEFLDHDGANDTFIESSRLHVDEAEARDSQLIENVRSVVSVLAPTGALGTFFCLSFCHKVPFLLSQAFIKLFIRHIFHNIVGV